MNHKIHNISLQFDEEFIGERIDKVLALHEQINSRSHASRLLKESHVLLDGLPVKASHKVLPNKNYIVEIPDVNLSSLEPYNFPLDIVYEDEDLLVINKPHGLVVHPSLGHMKDTLVNALIFHKKILSEGTEVFRPGIVHRLDKDTSGLILVAKNNKTHSLLSNQFQTKSINREYLCLSSGIAPLNHKQTLTSYLTRSPRDRKKFASGERGKLAITHIEILKSHPYGLHLIHCKLDTGRTHQIRVHLSENRLPILGDPMYGSLQLQTNTPSAFRKQVKKNTQMFLHAARLSFTHPVQNKKLVFTAPWPQSCHELLIHTDLHITLT